MISNEELAEFLREANKNTYANVGANKASSLRPNSEDYHYEKGDLTYHDTYFGARDFIGEEIVYKAGKPVWGMNYYGTVLNPTITTADAYKILRPALMKDSGDLLPVRGPQSYTEGTSTYTNRVDGTLEAFSGEENILISGQLVYRGLFHGGFIK